ncbi:hypothetical protein N9D23_14065, partial [Rubripirellula sp.]|nr:hypothetical protein [Rubripirellula sp.]
LHLDDTQVNDLTPLAQHKYLAELRLARTEVSDLSPLAGLTRLQSLDLNGTKVTDEQIKQLRLALPNCVISR